MKKAIIALFLLACQAGWSQITKRPGDFNQVKVFDRISVELIPAKENKVVISGERSAEVELINDNGDLKIRMPALKLLEGDDIDVQIFYTHLESVEASEGSNVFCGTTVKEIDMKLSVKEGAQIKLKTEVKNLDIKAVTGGKITVSGTADNLKIDIFTGGIVEGKALRAKTAKVNINAGGEADVNASDFVEARTNAGGEITIYGNPAKIDKKSVLGGTIEVGRE